MLQSIEIKQQQMMSFLARVMKNPAFIYQLLQQKEKRKELEEVMTKKRRKIGIGESSRGREGRNIVKVEPLELGDYEFGVSELEMQCFGKGKMDQEVLEDEGFWEELTFGEKFKDQFNIPALEDKDENKEDSSQ